MRYPLILLPGMMCDARLFYPQIAAISGRWPVFTAPICGANNMQKLAQDILQVAPPIFSLAGLSMGGIVAMEILRQAPERVDRLALLDTNPLPETASMKAKRATQMDAVKVGSLERVIREEMKPNYLIGGPDKQKISELCMKMANDKGAQAFVNQSLALRDRRDQREILSNFSGRSLVLCGEFDILCSPERHKLMSELLVNSRLEIIEDAGHLPTLEQPDPVNAAIMRWLEG
jgi:pimeloyl-ACP methyl ester carboxylesterase